MRDTRIVQFRLCGKKHLPVTKRVGKIDLDEPKFSALIGKWREFILRG
jgi:hypothetical protein